MNYSKTESELLVQTLRARDIAEGSVSQLHSIAQTNTDYYFGKLPLPDYEGGTTITDKIVWEHIEGAVSQLLPVFTSMENKAIKFTPYAPNDVEVADALTHHISHSILYKNKGKEVLEDAIRESFINRIAWVKTTWETCREADQHSFSEISKTQLKKLEKEWDEVVIEKNEDKKYTGYCLNYVETEGLKLDNIPLENMVFPAMTRNLDELPYIAQKTEMMKSELYDMFDKKIIDSLGDGRDFNYLRTRPVITNVDDFVSEEYVNDDNVDAGTDRYTVYEHYFLTSLLSGGENGDGALKWVQVFTCNDVMIDYSVVKTHPYSPIVSVPHVNSLVGWSFADLLKDIQDQRTKLERSAIANSLSLAYPRYQAVTGAYDVESLLNNVAGGVVEVDQIGNVQQFAETPIPSEVYQHIEWLGQEAQRITGISEMNQGLDPNVMNSNNAASTVLMQMNAGSKRVLSYGRNIAEGWKTVLLKAYDFIRENSTKLDVTNFNGKSFIISEKDMKERKLTITPVLGTDENQAQAQILIQLAERYKADPSLQKGYNSYQMEMMILDALGIPNRHLILTDPATIQPTEQEIAMQQMQMQQMQLQLAQLQGLVQNLGADVAVKQFSIQDGMAKTQLEGMKVQGDQQYNAENVMTDRAKLDLEAQKVGLEGVKVQQAGEIAANSANLEQTKFQHQATMDLSNLMTVDTEIGMEQAQGRAVRFGN